MQQEKQALLYGSYETSQALQLSRMKTKKNLEIVTLSRFTDQTCGSRVMRDPSSNRPTIVLFFRLCVFCFVFLFKRFFKSNYFFLILTTTTTTNNNITVINTTLYIIWPEINRNSNQNSVIYENYSLPFILQTVRNRNTHPNDRDYNSRELYSYDYT
uniref:Uncharacterized protein n=1 Tax=Glossina brevipalpis TaxID=37001 RepID=A0A1A9X0G5_9MUSC